MNIAFQVLLERMVTSTKGILLNQPFLHRIYYDISVTCCVPMLQPPAFLWQPRIAVRKWFSIRSINAPSLKKLELLPRNVQEKVEIEQAKFVLTSIKDLMIISVKFTACSFQYHANNIKGRGVNDSYRRMNAFYVSNSTFTLSRVCAIIINTGTEGGRVISSNQAGGLQNMIMNLQSSLYDSNNNSVDLNIQRSQFVSCKLYSGTVSAYWSSVLIEDSIFDSNIVTGSGNCKVSISENKGGAIIIKGGPIIIKGRNNFALDSGGAVYGINYALKVSVSLRTILQIFLVVQFIHHLFLRANCS